MNFIPFECYKDIKVLFRNIEICILLGDITAIYNFRIPEFSTHFSLESELVFGFYKRIGLEIN